VAARTAAFYLSHLLMMRPWLFPRWGIVLVDLAFCLIALAGAYQLRFNFQVPGIEYRLLWPMLPVYIAVRLAWYLAFGIQRSMVRHTGTNDARRVFLAVCGGTITLLLLKGCATSRWTASSYSPPR